MLCVCVVFCCVFFFFFFFPNFQGKILTNGSPDSYQQKFGLFYFKVEPFLSEDENIPLAAHTGQGPSLGHAPMEKQSPAWWPSGHGWPPHVESSGAGRRATRPPVLRKEFTHHGGKQEDGQRQGGDGGCHQRDFQGWGNICWGYLGRGIVCGSMAGGKH